MKDDLLMGTWLDEGFGAPKPVTAVLHLNTLPEDPVGVFANPAHRPRATELISVIHDFRSAL